MLRDAPGNLGTPSLLGIGRLLRLLKRRTGLVAILGHLIDARTQRDQLGLERVDREIVFLYGEQSGYVWMHTVSG
jgi:hypothetical protein